MDHLQAMRIFARVAHLGSFTKAAEQLQLPRPTVSNAVQDLEKHLKVRLLQRTTRRVALTAEGATYYERCTRRSTTASRCSTPAISTAWATTRC